MKTILSAFVFLFIRQSILAQPYPTVVGGRFHRGFIIPHSEAIKDISYSKPWGIEWDVSKHINSQAAWNECSCYPRIGLSAAYFNFDNPSVLGNAYWLTPYIEPMLGAHRKLFFSFRLGAGLAYLDNVYHPIRNPNNLFYSLPVSFSLLANTALNVRATSRFLLRLIANYHHISNGGIQLPNKGINFPTLSVGIDFTPFQDFMPKQRQAFDLNTMPKNEYWLYMFVTALNPTYGVRRRYPLIGLNFLYKRRLTRKSAFVVGTEVYADYSLQKSLEAQGLTYDYHKVGLLLGHDLLIGKFSIGTYLGGYLYSPAPTFDKLYQRWQIGYRAGRWQTQVALKAHRHVAAFLDVRVGYMIGKNTARVENKQQ